MTHEGLVVQHELDLVTNKMCCSMHRNGILENGTFVKDFDQTTKC